MKRKVGRGVGVFERGDKVLLGVFRGLGGWWCLRPRGHMGAVA